MKSLYRYLNLKSIMILTVLVSLLICAVAYAADAADPLPVADFFGQVWESIKGIKGAGAIGITLIVVQGIMMFFRTELAAWAGKWRLVVVYGLTIVVGVLALKIAGVSWGECLMHVQTLAAFQVFLNQLWKQIMTPKGDQVTAIK